MFKKPMLGLPLPVSGRALKQRHAGKGGKLLQALAKRTLAERRTQTGSKGSKFHLDEETMKVYKELKQISQNMHQRERDAVPQGGDVG